MRPGRFDAGAGSVDGMPRAKYFLMRPQHDFRDHDLGVTSVMSKPVSVDPSAVAHAALRLAAASGAHDIVVVAAGQPIGVVCVCDLERARPDRAIALCLDSSAVCIRSDRSVGDAWKRMKEQGVGTVPVVDEHNHLIGIVVRAKLREKLFGPAEPGVDVCMSCRGSHHLRAPRGEGTPKFCAACLSANPPVRLADGVYVTLGGSG
jgi:CBS-domain-containing membrane protein